MRTGCLNRSLNTINLVERLKNNDTSYTTDVADDTAYIICPSLCVVLIHVHNMTISCCKYSYKL